MQSKDGRQFVRYTFYKLDPQWRRLDSREKESHRGQFLAVVDELSQQMLLRSYSLLGTRGDADFMLWTVSSRLESFQELATRILSTGLGHYLSTPYSYLAMTKESTYVRGHHHPGQEGTRLTVAPRGAKYLFVYPFVKTDQWYALPQEQRGAMMSEHIAVGHKYPGVKTHTTYSFGLDDQEFTLAFEADDPAEFLDLVTELREVEARRYTLRDTPIFTCVSMETEQVVRSLGD